MSIRRWLWSACLMVVWCGAPWWVNGEEVAPAAEGAAAAPATAATATVAPTPTPEAATATAAVAAVPGKKAPKDPNKPPLHVRQPKVAPGGQVMVVPVRDDISQVTLYVLRRALREAAEQPDLRAIVLDMDTPGGRLDVTQEVIDNLRACKVPVYVYVNNWAASAGAIISLACDAIYMAPGSRIGAAAPILMSPEGGVQDLPAHIQEKILSDLRAMVRGLAEEKGYPEDVAMAFVDLEHGAMIGDRVICEEGELLMLTAQEAIEVIPPRTRPLLATAVVDTLPDLLAAVKLKDAQVIRVEVSASEKLAKWIIMLSPLLMLGFMLGLYTEIKTPGFGLPGTIAIVCLLLYLFGHYVAGLAGYEEAAIILIGVVLLLVEIFVLPGFGVIGFLGVGLILTGLVMAMLPYLPKDMPNLPGEIGPVSDIGPYVNRALINLTITVVATAAGMWLLAKLLPKVGVYSRLVLSTSMSATQGCVGVDVATPRSLIGTVGEALTPLRPSGVAMIGGQRLDVVSSGDFIAKGSRVRITKVNGPRIEVVRAAEDEPSPPAGQALRPA